MCDQSDGNKPGPSIDATTGGATKFHVGGVLKVKVSDEGVAIFGASSFSGSAVFNGNATFNGEVTFNGITTFRGSIILDGENVKSYMMDLHNRTGSLEERISKLEEAANMEGPAT